MEHLWTPLTTLLSGIVSAILAPFMVWKLAQIKEARESHRQEIHEARDYEMECLRWADYAIYSENAFKALLQAWREGGDLKYPMAAMEAALSAKPRAMKREPTGRESD